jgi:hypothetical protein
LIIAFSSLTRAYYRKIVTLKLQKSFKSYEDFGTNQLTKEMEERLTAVQIFRLFDSVNQNKEMALKAAYDIEILEDKVKDQEKVIKNKDNVIN